ncbi:MAG: hypothetical protein ABI700_30915, partial [Chloroflexota bacterium]
TVLEINPGNAKAREVLDRIQAREGDTESAPAAAPTPSSSGSKRIRSLDPMMETPPGAVDEGPGTFKIPVKIPGAPEQTTWEKLGRDGIGLLRIGLDVMLRKPGVYEDEVSRATWWRFWLISGTAAVGGGILSLFNALFLQIRFTTSLFNIIAVLLTPFFFVAFALLTLFIGCYGSYRWAQSQGGGGSLLSHAYTVALVWAPLMLLNSVISFAFNLFGFGAWLVSLLLSIYAIIVIADGFERLHAFTDPRQKWITAVVMIVAQVIVTFILGLIFGGLIVARALPFAF